jgi:hypothetical protein
MGAFGRNAAGKPPPSLGRVNRAIIQKTTRQDAKTRSVHSGYGLGIVIAFIINGTKNSNR